MRNIWIICRKEMRSYFVSPVAYILLALFAIAFGYSFWNYVGMFVYESIESQMRGGTFPMSVNEQVIRPLISGYLTFIGLVLIPIISMRLFAEEKRTGTFELLATSPIRDYEIILGKWLAAVLLYSAMLLLSAMNFAWLFKYGNPDWKPLAIGYLGLFLQAGLMLAIGIFISSLTRNQIIAGAVSFVVCLLLWIIGWMNEYDSTPTAHVMAYLSIPSHFESFSKGLLSLKDAVFFVTGISLGLFLTSRSLESLRWRS